MKPQLRNKYLSVNLSIKGKQKRFNIHRLVATLFLENAGNKPCVNHIDGDKTNNSCTNLEWVTYSENAKHAFSLGLCDMVGFKMGNKAAREKHSVDCGGALVELQSPEGIVHKIQNLREFCRDKCLTRTLVRQVILGNRNHHKNWRVAV